MVRSSNGSRASTLRAAWCTLSVQHVMLNSRVLSVEVYA